MTTCDAEPDAVDKEKGRFALALSLVLPERSIKMSNRTQLSACLQHRTRSMLSV